MKVDSEKCVFIVGMPRTASKLYRYVISKHSDINISREIHFINPRWIRKDVITKTKEEIGEINNAEQIRKFVDYCFTKKFFGMFWNWIKGDKERLFDLIESTDRSWKSILTAILIFDAEANGKRVAGAKFPVHITRAQILFDWFPNCKVIHVIRNPMAIYSSQKKKHRKSHHTALSKAIATGKIFLGTLLSYKKATEFHCKNADNPNYILFRYEDLVSTPHKVISSLCEFIEIEYTSEMLLPPSKDSSYTTAPSTKGIHTTSLEKWKHELNTIEKLIYRLFLARDIKRIYG